MELELKEKLDRIEVQILELEFGSITKKKLNILLDLFLDLRSSLEVGEKLS